MIKRITILLLFISIFNSYAQEQITLAWDTSFSMETRNSNLEFRYLDNYFKAHPSIDVRMVTFNNIKHTQYDFNISNGNWSAIKEILNAVVYDGATSYNTIAKFLEENNSMIFTDGNITTKSLPITSNYDISIISTHKNKAKGIERLTKAENIHFVQLTDANTPSAGVSTTKMTYKGTVFVEEGDLNDVKIMVKESGSEIKVNTNGTYQFSAMPGETLQFKTSHNQQKEITLTQSPNLNVWIKSSGIQLDEVFLSNEKDIGSTEEINTGYKKVNKRSLGYEVKTISSEDINQSSSDISNAINGKVSGVNQGYGKDISTAKLRQANSMLWAKHPLILIDGAPIPKSITTMSAGTTAELTSFIDVNNIGDITILKGFAATNQYGSEGVGGVILITTKQAFESKANGGKASGNPQNKNVYSGNILPNNISVKSSYIKELEKEVSIEAAYTKYVFQRKNHINKPLYFTDIYRFFRSSNQQLATQIAYNYIELNDTPQSGLRGLLFEATANKDYGLALDVAKDLMKKFPQHIQSYLDLAIAYKNNGASQKSLDLLLGIERGTINQSLDFTALKKIADNEIRTLVFERKAELELSKIDVKHLNKTKLDARIVFDWSNSNAEFELQFVNPTKLFFTWDHNMKNTSRLEQEFVNGFSQEEFEIDGGAKGQWLINVKYLGNKSKNDPSHTLLKCTIQYDYGTPKERTEEKIIRLHQINQEQQVVNLFTK